MSSYITRAHLPIKTSSFSCSRYISHGIAINKKKKKEEEGRSFEPVTLRDAVMYICYEDKSAKDTFASADA